MNVKRLAFMAFLFGAVGFLWVEIFFIIKEVRVLSHEYEAIAKEKEELEEENEQLGEDLSYYSIPENLKKELKERLNYKEPGEHLMIIVPSQ